MSSRIVTRKVLICNRCGKISPELVFFEPSPGYGFPVMHPESWKATDWSATLMTGLHYCPDCKSGQEVVD